MARRLAKTEGHLSMASIQIRFERFTAFHISTSGLVVHHT
jgi:hypothetical protein